MKIKSILTSVASLSLVAANCAERPNIVLIMCDDMGYSTLGCYGSEVETPNFDLLGENGIRFTQFKNTGRSCPSRASLLTGCYPHNVDMGWMTAVDEHREGYRGEITSQVPTIAEVLKSGEYETYMSGKWHVTGDDAYLELEKSEIKPNGSFPTDRGFDRYYGALTGGGSYYDPVGLLIDDKPVLSVGGDYYYTDAITENAVKFIDKHDVDKPMFLYVAHYAPHLPLQAPQERIDKCRERYEVGYDVVREKRFERMVQMGIIPIGGDAPIHNDEFNDGVRISWEDFDPIKRERWINDAATYAAMVEIADDGIGEIIEATKRKGIYDNTIFIMLSDNGGTEEQGEISKYLADLNNTPFREYKKRCYLGGTSSPLIIFSELYKDRAGQINNDCYTHINDIMPTCLDMAKIEYPEVFAGGQITPPDGVTILPALSGGEIEPRDLYFEHESSAAIISGKWRLVRADMNSEWELIDLDKNPYEVRSLTTDNEAKIEELRAKWQAWAEGNKVFPLENKLWKDRIPYYNNRAD